MKARLSQAGIAEAARQWAGGASAEALADVVLLNLVGTAFPEPSQQRAPAADTGHMQLVPVLGKKRRASDPPAAAPAGKSPKKKGEPAWFGLPGKPLVCTVCIMPTPI